MKNIESKFSERQNQLVIQQSDLSLKSISDMVSEKAIDISPKYQRRERWDAQRQSDLIESFILNIPVPPIYLAEDHLGTYSVIDGKQRITAINQFLTGKLKIENPANFSELEGYSFSDLPKVIQNALTLRPYLRVVTLLKQSTSGLKHEVFLRLNKAGVALNSQEIRNVAFRGELNDMIIELSSNNFLKRILKSTPKSKVYREMEDVRYVLRFFTVRSSWQNFPGNMDKAMDEFMLQNIGSSAQDLNTMRNHFLRAISACEKIWGDQSFLRPNGSKRVMQGFYDVQMVALSLLSKNILSKIETKASSVRRIFNQSLIEDSTFSESITQFTSNPKSVNYRISKMVELMESV